MDYATLVASKSTPGSIGDWCNDSRVVNSATIIVDEAQDWIYQRLRHWRMMPPPVTGTMPTTVNYMTPPADMLEPNFLMITGVNRRIIRQVAYQEVMAAWTYDSNGNLLVQMPRFYSFDQTFLQFDSVPDQAYPYAFLYYQMPARLSSSNTTNFLTTYCERLMRTVIMMHACEWTKEIGQGQFDRSWYESEAMKELDRVQAASDRARRGVSGGWIDGGGDHSYGWPS